MSFQPNDWSSLSYKEVMELLERYRSDYIYKSPDMDVKNVRIMDDVN